MIISSDEEPVPSARRVKLRNLAKKRCTNCDDSENECSRYDLQKILYEIMHPAALWAKQYPEKIIIV